VGWGIGSLNRLDGRRYLLSVTRVRVALAVAICSFALTAEDCSGVTTTDSPGVAITATAATTSATATVTPTATPTAPPAQVAAPPPALAPAANADPYPAATAAGASAVCHDGTWSFSKHRSGTCSSHGGVHWWTGNLGPAGPGDH
jgi:serine/threonine-protein kinase